VDKKPSTRVLQPERRAFFQGQKGDKKWEGEVERKRIVIGESGVEKGEQATVY